MGRTGLNVSCGHPSEWGALLCTSHQAKKVEAPPPLVCDLRGVLSIRPLAKQVYLGKKTQVMSPSYIGSVTEWWPSDGATSIFHWGVHSIQINVPPFLFKYLVFKKHHAAETCRWVRKKLISLTVRDLTNPRGHTATGLGAECLGEGGLSVVFLFSPIMLPG